jgi:hypothetical protein
MSTTADNLCDGCNVRPPWEHRCHGSSATVRGESTGRPCSCDECNSGEACPLCGNPIEGRVHGGFGLCG